MEEGRKRPDTGLLINAVKIHPSTSNTAPVDSNYDEDLSFLASLRFIGA
jgi:hypothetical protein